MNETKLSPKLVLKIERGCVVLDQQQQLRLGEAHEIISKVFALTTRCGWSRTTQPRSERFRLLTSAATICLGLFALGSATINAATPAATPGWISQPLSVSDALNIALSNNVTILKSGKDVSAASGVAIQTRAIVIPKLQATSDYTSTDPDSIETFPGSTVNFSSNQRRWGANLRLIQSVYEGGRMISSGRTARLLKEQAYLNYQTVVADTLTEVRVAYYDVLLSAEQITVQNASVELLTRQLSDTRARFEAGAVPSFNLLRAEVELSNVRPRLIRARNTHRVAKHNLVNLLGWSVPKEVLEDIPLSLTDSLEAEPFSIDLSAALLRAWETRTELAALGKARRLREENIVEAKAGYKPSVQLFGGYGARNSQFSDDLTEEVHGWTVGAQLSWNIFDGFLTRGKVREAEALHEKAGLEVEETMRQIELEVRTAYSNFIEAQEVLASQKKVIEQAEEALRLAEGRFKAGSSVQLDILSAQTALTDSRSTRVQALRDYEVAKARLERAMGLSIQAAQAP